jgi:hypothetical protein
MELNEITNTTTKIDRSDLDLSNKQITTLDNDHLNAFTMLTSLNLSNNLIEQLPNQIFSSLNHLININLSNNRLSTLPNDLFKSLKSIKKINISNNQIKEISVEVFQSINKLDQINMSNNELINLPIFSSNLTMIKIFDFSFNKLTHLQADYFIHFKSVNYLDLSNNLIKSISNQFFQQLSIVQSINLSNNLITNLESNLFANMNQLTTFSIAKNYLKTLPTDLFSNIKFMLSLDLSFNNLTKVDFQFNTMLKSMSCINLSNNQITEINNKSIFKHLNKVYTLNLSYNRLEHLPADLFMNTEYENICLSNNRLKNIDFLQQTSSFNLLDLASNHIKSISNCLSSNLQDTSTARLVISNNYLNEINFKFIIKLPDNVKIDFRFNIDLKDYDKIFACLFEIKSIDQLQNGHQNDDLLLEHSFLIRNNNFDSISNCLLAIYLSRTITKISELKCDFKQIIEQLDDEQISVLDFLLMISSKLEFNFLIDLKNYIDNILKQNEKSLTNIEFRLKSSKSIENLFKCNDIQLIQTFLPHYTCEQDYCEKIDFNNCFQIHMANLNDFNLSLIY